MAAPETTQGRPGSCGKRLDERGCARHGAGALDLFQRDGLAEGQVVEDGAAEQLYGLGDDAKGAPSLRGRESTGVYSRDANAAAPRSVEPRGQLERGRLAGAGASDKGHVLPARPAMKSREGRVVHKRSRRRPRPSGGPGCAPARSLQPGLSARSELARPRGSVLL